MRDDELPVDPDQAPRFREATDGRHRRWDVAVVIGVGGAIGALARHGLSEWWPHGPDGFPWSTLVENVSGCFLIGVVVVMVVDVWRSDGARRYLRPFLAVGVLGGFTTFSAYAVDVRTLATGSSSAATAAYLFGTVLGALVATWAGLALGRAIAGVPQRSVRARRAS